MLCECGCGTPVTPDSRNRPRRFIHNHHADASHLPHMRGTESTSYKHGQVNTPTYRSWAAMLRRCYNPNWHRYDRYGGRGITVCERWRGDQGFENFLADMGERPARKSLDRKEVHGNYEPLNCGWKTQKEQMENTSRAPRCKWYSRRHWYNLRTLTLARDPICKRCNRSPSAIADHIIPHKGVWELFSDLLNLQGLCSACHSLKTAREDGGWGRPVAVAQRTETPKPVPTGEKGGLEFQSSSINSKKLDKALIMEDDFLEGIPE